MTLENLLALHRLLQVTPDKVAVGKLLSAARRNLTDARLEAVSADTRFDAAYRVIMQCAMLGLLANGYRTSTSQPGHHQTAIQALPKSMGVAADRVVVLDVLRRKRNLSDYDGEPVAEALLKTCIDEAEKLLEHTETWLRQQHPELLD
ncbi:hypothetical protein D3C78_1010370 [compost metagenome]